MGEGFLAAIKAVGTTAKRVGGAVLNVQRIKDADKGKIARNTIIFLAVAIFIILSPIIITVGVPISLLASFGEKGAGNTVIDAFKYQGDKNNYALVEWCEDAVANGWGYMTGTYGNVCTESLIDAKANQYPDHVNKSIVSKWTGRRTADCIGLIKGYMWYDAENDTITYQFGGFPDIGAGTPLTMAQSQKLPWGVISGKNHSNLKYGSFGVPEIPGIALVYADGSHIGVYIGEGRVIQAANSRVGVTNKWLINQQKWHYWCYIPGLNYLDKNPYTSITYEEYGNLSDEEKRGSNFIISDIEKYQERIKNSNYWAENIKKQLAKGKNYSGTMDEGDFDVDIVKNVVLDSYESQIDSINVVANSNGSYTATVILKEE